MYINVHLQLMERRLVARDDKCTGSMPERMSKIIHSSHETATSSHIVKY